MNDKYQSKTLEIQKALVKFFNAMSGDDLDVPFPTESVLASLVIDVVPPSFIDQIMKFAAMPIEELQAARANGITQPEVQELLGAIMNVLGNSMIVRTLIGAGIVDADLFRKAYHRAIDAYRTSATGELNRLSDVLTQAGFLALNAPMQEKLAESISMVNMKADLSIFIVETMFLDTSAPGPQLLANWNPVAARTAAAKLIHPEKADLIAEVEKLL